MGTDEMPDDTYDIDEDGVEKTLKKILGTEIGEFKKLGEGEYEQEFKCDIIDGAKVEKPVTVVMHFTLQGEFLIMEENYPDSDYAPFLPNVYRKVKWG